MSGSRVSNGDFEECIQENYSGNKVSDKEWMLILRCLNSWEHMRHYI